MIYFMHLLNNFDKVQKFYIMIDNILTKESFSDIKSIYKLLGKEQELQTWLEKLIEKN